MKSKEYFIN